MPISGTLCKPISKVQFNTTDSSPLKSGGRLSQIIARILKAILPKAWFCWVSRATIQIQCKLDPKKWAYWNKLSDQIYLGAMPLKNWDHINKITALGVKAVLSINEDYEFQTQLFADPVKEIDWKNRNIAFLRISSPDLEPIELSKLAVAVHYVAKHVNLGNSVYIHCTGGRARSVSVAICALIKTKAWTLEVAFKHVKQCRPQLMLNQKQIENIKAWYGI